MIDFTSCHHHIDPASATTGRPWLFFVCTPDESILSDISVLKPIDVLGPEGLIASRLPHYEERPEQLRMADAVAAALRDKRHLIVEAGTGVGKSFAYLVPAILAAAGDESGSSKTIVVSTHTISLQEQILRQDVPLLNSVIPLEFTTVLVKGRRNYLSRRRLAVARARAQSLFNEPDEFDELSQLSDWSLETNDGSLSGLVFAPRRTVWDEIASDHGNCMGRSCPEFARCFYYRERQRMRHAQLLIVNHALLFTDLALRARGASLLPDYDAVIIDEAHTVPATAGDHLGLGVSSGQVEFALTRLYNDRTNKGMLVHNQCQAAELSGRAMPRCC